MNRRAVVSGGGIGIGLAITRALVTDGCEVVIIGRRRAVVERAANEVNAEYGRELVTAAVADLSQSAPVAAVAELITAGGQGVDVLVNNAGGNHAPVRASEVDGLREQYLANFAANVLTAVLLTHALLPALARPGGRVITIGSIAAVRGNASYGAAKAALHPWSTELAGQLAPEGITVNVVAPGYIGGTEFYGDRMSDAFHAERSRQAPVGRAGEADEVAALVAYLAGPASGFVTGQVLHINGGILGRG